MKGKIVFIDKNNNKETIFFTEENNLNNKQMWWLNLSPQMYVSDKREVNKIIKFIKNEHKIISNTIK